LTSGRAAQRRSQNSGFTNAAARFSFRIFNRFRRRGLSRR
jgi:hypothetical protein